MELQVVMPIGGVGSRFAKVGIQTPKPLIDVRGMPMFFRAIRSVQALGFETEYIFVIREDQDAKFNLGRTITHHVPSAKIVVLKEESPGASSTVLAAKSLLDPALPLLVLDCDIAFESEEYKEKILEAIRGAADGVLLSFQSTEPRYSFARTDENGLVVETAEKVAISNNALMGAYFFTKARNFINAAEDLNRIALSSSMPEYYMSLTFNHLLNSGKRVSLARGDFYCFGTPEELDEYLKTGRPIAG